MNNLCVFRGQPFLDVFGLPIHYPPDQKRTIRGIVHVIVCIHGIKVLQEISTIQYKVETDVCMIRLRYNIITM